MLDELGGFDAGFGSTARTSTCSTGRCGRLAALVRARRGRPARAPRGDGSPVPDAPDAVALAWDRSLRAQASRAASNAVTDIEAKYDSLADGFSEREYADPARYSAGRARLVVELGHRLEPGNTVLDLGCGDGIMAAPLLAYGLVYGRRPEHTDGRGGPSPASGALVRPGGVSRTIARPSRSMRRSACARSSTPSTGSASSEGSPAIRRRSSSSTSASPIIRRHRSNATSGPPASHGSRCGRTSCRSGGRSGARGRRARGIGAHGAAGGLSLPLRRSDLL